MSRPVRILVLEDDVSLREVLEQVLKSRGFEVVVSSRGEEAIQHARGERFDLIVADIRMEGMNGLDTIERAKELQPDIGSIVVSGFASEEETLRAVKLNVAGYLKKPFKIDALLELVNKHLADRGEERAREDEVSALKKSLFWSLRRQGHLAEKLFPGRVERASHLAAQLARQMGFSGSLPTQLHHGTLLKALAELGEFEAPDFLMQSLEGYPMLLSVVSGETPPETSRFALAVSEAVGPDGSLPAVDLLEGDWDARLLEAYSRLISSPEEDPQEKLSVSGLLSLARTLEHAGDWAGAHQAYREVGSLQSISAEGVQARLGMARVAVAQGDTKQLEAAVKEVLDTAREMGPVSHALAELEAAQVLRRARHPASLKLLTRAAKNLESVNLEFPEARARLSLCAADVEYRGENLDGVVDVLSSSGHRLELLEHLEQILVDLLTCLSQSAPEKGKEFLQSLIFDYPSELLQPLATGRVDAKERSVVLEVADGAGRPLPKVLMEYFAQDPVGELRERALSLETEQGTQRASVLRIYGLGTLEVSIGGKGLDLKELKTQKTRFLLARLLANTPKALAVERVMDEFWPDSPDGARNNLNTSVSLIRRFLKDPQSEIDPLLRIGETISINPDLPVWHDVDEMDRANAAAQKAVNADNMEVGIGHLRRVVQLYRGPYLESCYMDWALDRRTRLEIRVISALRLLCENLSRQRRHAETLEYALRLLAIQPDDVEGHEAVMHSFIGLDQHDRAVEHFESYQRALAREGEEADMQLLRTYQMAKYGMKPEAGLEL
jgi:two-component SAPR family response regulator